MQTHARKMHAMRKGCSLSAIDPVVSWECHRDCVKRSSERFQIRYRRICFCDKGNAQMPTVSLNECGVVVRGWVSSTPSILTSEPKLWRGEGPWEP